MSQTVVPAAARSVITATPRTTFKVGTYSALTDTFTSVLDLNDHVSYWLVKADVAQPEKVYSRTSTIRAAGERITNWNYKNRHITLTLQLLYQNGTQALLTAVRSLLTAIENPPYRLAFAPPNSTVLTYADVVAVKHTIPSDAKLILNKAISNIIIDFECAPGLSGDRITLSNLVVNPGFEAPSGPGVQVFNDNFANTNAYSLNAGTAPSVAANVMTIPANSTVMFGSPSWGALQNWQLRMQWNTGASIYLFAHYTDANNWTAVIVNGSQFVIQQNVAATVHTISSGTATLTNGQWVWIGFTQYPSAPGTVPQVQATIYNDSAGAIGSSIVFLSPTVLNSATAITGQPRIQVLNAACAFGGAFSSVHTVSLFGPGGWAFGGAAGGSTGQASGAWEQNTANTYAGGAVTSFGAGRLDLPPAGTINAGWASFSGGAPAGTSAIPASSGQVLQFSAQAKSSGLHATNALVELLVNEFDTNGSFLRQDTIQTKTGSVTNGGWTQLSGTVTLGASCAYVAMILQVMDTTVAGESANATVWFDNAQMWNQTTTGQTVMPYCELRFPMGPAQLMVSGLQGDMPAPAATACGLFVSGSPASTSASLYLGRRRYASKGAKLVYPVEPAAMGVNGGSGSPSGVALDSSDVFGFHAVGSSTMSVTHGYTTQMLARDLQGYYHYFIRGYTANSSPSTAVSIYNAVEDGQVANNFIVDCATGQKLYPCAGGAGWYWMDTGQIDLPVYPLVGQADPANIFEFIGTPNFADAGHNALDIGAGFLLPVDGEVVVAGLYNMLICSNNWLYIYIDAQTTATNISLETTPVSNIANAAGGGRDTTGTNLSVSGTGDTGLRLDPTTTSGYASGTPTTPTNQFVALCYDNNMTAFPVAVEFTYAPLYLYPRES